MDELLKPQNAQFEIVWANRHTSKAGRESIRLRLRCTQGATSATVYTYLGLNPDKRLQAFASALSRCPLDRLQDADDEELKRLIGLTGRCVLAIEESADYPPKNVIKFWQAHEFKASKPLGPIDPHPFGTNQEVVRELAPSDDDGWADLSNLPF